MLNVKFYSLWHVQLLWTYANVNEFLLDLRLGLYCDAILGWVSGVLKSHIQMNHIGCQHVKIKHQREQSTRKIFPACVPMKAVALAAIHILRDVTMAGPWWNLHILKLPFLPPKKWRSITTTHLKFDKAPEMETSQNGKYPSMEDCKTNSFLLG